MPGGAARGGDRSRACHRTRWRAGLHCRGCCGASVTCSRSLCVCSRLRRTRPPGSVAQAPAPRAVVRPPRARARVARRAEDAGGRGGDPAGAAAGGRGRAAGVRGAGRSRGRGAAGAAAPAAPAAAGAGDPAPAPVLPDRSRSRRGLAGPGSSVRAWLPVRRRAGRSSHRQAPASASVCAAVRDARRPRHAQAGYVWRPGMPAPGALAAASPGGYGAARPAYGGQPYTQSYGAQLRPAAPAPRALTEDERRVLPQKARLQHTPDTPLACTYNDRAVSPVGFCVLLANACWSHDAGRVPRSKVWSGARPAASDMHGGGVRAAVLGLPAHPCDAHNLARLAPAAAGGSRRRQLRQAGNRLAFSGCSVADTPLRHAEPGAR